MNNLKFLITVFPLDFLETFKPKADRIFHFSNFRPSTTGDAALRNSHVSDLINRMGERKIARTVLKQVRDALDLTQDQASKITGVSASTISKWETGKQGINVEDAQRYLERLGFPPPALFSLCLLESWRQQVMDSEQWVPSAPRSYQTTDRGGSGQFINEATAQSYAGQVDAFHLSMARHLVEFLKIWMDREGSLEDPPRG